MYDEMAIVVGKDMATGSFAKSFNDINVEENEVNSINIEDDSLEEVTAGKATSSYAPSSQAKSQRKRSRSFTSLEDCVEKVSGQLGELAKAVNNLSQNQLNVDKLYKEVMKMEDEGFEHSSLGDAFDHLMENVNQAKAFIAKDNDLKKVWLRNFFQQRKN